MKVITLVAMLALLVGCTPATPEEKTARDVRYAYQQEQHIKRNSYEVCIRGMTYLYHESGNASQAILLLDPKTSRVLPCKEAE